MKYYTAFLEGLTSAQEQELMTLFFSKLNQYFKKQKNITIDKKNEKIWQRDKLFFYFDKKTRLLETERVNECKATLIKISIDLGLDTVCTNFFENLQFASSPEEALMLNSNGLLFSKSPRTHQNKNKKTTLLYDGVVSAEFGLAQVLDKNAGLILGHVHTDLSSYCELRELLPILQQQGLKAIYLELPYNTFSPLFNNFNKNKEQDTNQILAELKKNQLFKDNLNDEGKLIIENFRKLFIAAKKASINIYPCDVISLNFTDQTLKQVDKKHRLKVGDACMIRSIEKLQFDQKYPKFLALVGLAHAKNIAQELGVPSCFIGEKKQSQIHQEYISGIDYLCLSDNKALYPSGATPFLTFASHRFGQEEDPKIKVIIDHWNKLIQGISITFEKIPASEMKNAREVYIEYILEKLKSNKNEISTICTSSQQFITERLIKAIYPKSIELVHPKNWCSLFQCQRPYGIRLAETEADAFTVTLLNDLTIEKPAKLHSA